MPLSRRTATAALATLATLPAAAQPLPQPASGRIERLPDFPSKHVLARHVDVWLPDNYDPARRCNVVYLHDGQMLFDARTTWNGQAWHIDAAVARLLRDGRLPDTLVVGIWNHAPLRYAEYYPGKMLALAAEGPRREYVEQGMAGRSLSDAYLRFIVEELKPAIDRRFATRPGRESTFVMGASMGGLVSLYALCEYPQVFGGAAGLSTHWVGLPTAWGLARVRNAAFPLAAFQYLAQRLPAPGAHRLYSDRGSVGLDALYAPSHAFVAELLRDRGYGPGDSATPVFEGTDHSERAWAARVDSVLGFLLGA